MTRMISPAKRNARHGSSRVHATLAARTGLQVFKTSKRPPELQLYSEAAVVKADKEARWKAQAMRHLQAELRAIARAATRGPAALLQHVYQVCELAISLCSWRQLATTS